MDPILSIIILIVVIIVFLSIFFSLVPVGLWITALAAGLRVNIFSLLGIVLPREPVRVAFEALDVDDPQLRGLALEYIESALPPDIRSALLERIHGVPSEEQPRRAEGQIREEFVSFLTELRNAVSDRTGTPPPPTAAV